ncbi:MAG: endonuclease III [Deltaproteobacteria bacterium GWA2_38_16]|nr:MAG: endonuclease III [Deltaproteobacteria bacterium GWA2_38_16]OGQ02457.1 MAG: endonuclease III [Deltaproteobacteria bacterium RIFCSPHIGHO2_02_FULL_38_15]OGQ34875.1 MAG: endonuclease III [Deltaproteobacteria bacterium RIFCSPLOWO2_01_FULL_38_9]OGQ60004.1 MAG: endonuclease III [Deltaproteobacteria bacterium RIFCSPLOWO2_12_FULL_38_8]HBQ21089.1 endonuclease III [Deltaproteobacteria bacterium]
MNLKARTLKIFTQLKKNYPNAKCALNFKNPLELIVATQLSAQCTDIRVNIVTPPLFKKYKTAKDYANANPLEFQKLIRSTGFFVNKTKSILGACKKIAVLHKGQVPRTLEELVELPGVGRKTANVILGNAFNTPGLVVDTHVLRLTQRMGLTKNRDPVKVEFDMMKLIPQPEWTLFSHVITHHGRQICIARKPLCSKCSIEKWCPKVGVIHKG